MPARVPKTKKTEKRASKTLSKPSESVVSQRKRKAESESPRQPAATRRKHDSDPARRGSKRQQAPDKQPQPVKKSPKPARTQAEKARKGPPPPAINRAPAEEALSVFVFGSGDCGELGLGPKVNETLRPVLNQFLDPTSGGFHVVQMACGGMHGIALTKDSRIVTWGVNDKGALGRDSSWDGARLRDADAESSDDDNDDLNPLEATPTQISATSFPPDTKFVQVAACDNSSFALTDTGSVYGWGTFLDSEGQESFAKDGDGNLIKVQKSPLLIPGLKKITQIACGNNHALALDATGNVWAWGVGEQNQLGRRIIGRRAGNSVVPSRVGICRNNVKYIASGQRHCFAVDNKDDVWAWGLNNFGQAGGADDIGILPRPMKIPGLCSKSVAVLAGGLDHSAAVTSAGECLVWGRVDGGQLGIKFTADQLADETLIKNDERDKPRCCVRPVAVPNIGEAAHVSCGTGHTIFINRAGEAYGSGFGTMGQLGLPSGDDVEVAERLNSKVLKGRVLTWTGAGGNYSVVAGSAQVTQGA